MKTIKNIDVRVTYNVALSDIEVPDDVYDALMNKEGDEIDGDNYNLTDEELKVEEWLCHHISESDAYKWRHRIDEIE